MSDGARPRPAGPGAGLRAVTRPLERGPGGPLDLLEFAGRDGLLFVREGVGSPVGARRRASDRRGTCAAGVHRRGRRGGAARVRPVAFGAFPFEPSAPAEVVVPSEVVGRAADGTTWHTVLEGAPPAPRPAPPRGAGGSFRLPPSRPADEWMAAVAEATRRIRPAGWRRWCWRGTC